MYRIKEGKHKEIKKIITNRKIAEITGLNEGYVSQILEAKRLDVSKTAVYAICKSISPDLEITDLFDII